RLPNVLDDCRLRVEPRGRRPGGSVVLLRQEDAPPRSDSHQRDAFRCRVWAKISGGKAMSLHDLATIEASRATRHMSRWERCLYHYELLIDAGLSHGEALRIAEETTAAEYQERQAA